MSWSWKCIQWRTDLMFKICGRFGGGFLGFGANFFQPLTNICLFALIYNKIRKYYSSMNQPNPIMHIRINPNPAPKNSLFVVPSSQEVLALAEGADGKIPMWALRDYELELVCRGCQKWLRGQEKVIVNSDKDLPQGNSDQRMQGHPQAQPHETQTVYCVGCFAKLLPACQSYQVIGHHGFELIGGGWAARHELLMLEALDRYGFGNWKAVQEYMCYLGANYQQEQIQSHYYDYYTKKQEQSDTYQPEIHNTSLKNVINQKKNKKGGKCVHKTTRVIQEKFYLKEQEELACFNPRRQQFTIEYNENLEKAIADLQFRENDSQRQTQLKFKMLEAYNAGLKDRQQKHNFIIEHRLLDQAYQAQEMRYLEANPYARKAHENLLPMMRAYTRDQYLQARSQLQFCFRVQALIDSLRQVAAKTPNKLISELSQPQGKPRKRVHLDPDRDEVEEKQVLKKLNIRKQDLMALIEDAHELGETVISNGIKVTPLSSH